MAHEQNEDMQIPAAAAARAHRGARRSIEIDHGADGAEEVDASAAEESEPLRERADDPEEGRPHSDSL